MPRSDLFFFFLSFCLKQWGRNTSRRLLPFPATATSTMARRPSSHRLATIAISASIWRRRRPSPTYRAAPRWWIQRSRHSVIALHSSSAVSILECVLFLFSEFLKFTLRPRNFKKINEKKKNKYKSWNYTRRKKRCASYYIYKNPPIIKVEFFFYISVISIFMFDFGSSTGFYPICFLPSFVLQKWRKKKIPRKGMFQFPETRNSVTVDWMRKRVNTSLSLSLSIPSFVFVEFVC